MKEKISGLSQKSKIILIFVLFALVIFICIGYAFASNSFISKETKQEIKSSKEISKQSNIPDVTSKNTRFDISETEETEESVIVNVSDKLEEYNLYYYIQNIETTESEEVEEQENSIDNTEYILYEDKIEIISNSNIYFKYESQGKYSTNTYLLEINNITEQIEESELENEMATEEELQKAKVTSIDNTNRYYVVVNCSSNVVTVYEKDSEGNYTVPVKAMVCSTGSATPKSGIYKLTRSRYRWRALFGGVYGQYAVPIVGNILFHSVPYTQNGDNSSLEYWEYDKLGTAASAGCVRLTVADAIWIYNNCVSGTQVEFSTTASNPLGKPSARKISSYTDLRGYDPTDPIANNPWKNANISNTKQESTPNNTESNPTQSTVPSTSPSPEEIQTPTTPENTNNSEQNENKNDEEENNQDKVEDKQDNDSAESMENPETN